MALAVRAVKSALQSRAAGRAIVCRHRAANCRIPPLARNRQEMNPCRNSLKESTSSGRSRSVRTRSCSRRLPRARTRWLCLSLAQIRGSTRTVLTQTKPGELFIQRTAGNIVPPYGSVFAGEACTIEYAVMALGIKDIVICGHSHCGAMAGTT